MIRQHTVYLAATHPYLAALFLFSFFFFACGTSMTSLSWVDSRGPLRSLVTRESPASLHETKKVSSFFFHIRLYRFFFFTFHFRNAFLTYRRFASFSFVIVIRRLPYQFNSFVCFRRSSYYCLLFFLLLSLLCMDVCALLLCVFSLSTHKGAQFFSFFFFSI